MATNNSDMESETELFPRMELADFVDLFSRACEYQCSYCFILGSGASRDAGIKTGVEMISDWINELKTIYAPKDQSEHNPNPEQKHIFPSRRLKARMKELEISDDQLIQKSENYFPVFKLRYSPVYKEGHAYLEREIRDIKPSLGHYSLARILACGQHNVVVTTNFDSLVEDSLFIYTDQPPLVIGHEALAEYVNYATKRPTILKLHRSIYYGPRNSEEEVADLDIQWIDPLRILFALYSPIVIGYAGGDQSLMRFLEIEDCAIGRLYWCYKHDNTPDQRIIELVRKKGGVFIPIASFDQLMFLLAEKLKIPPPKDFLMGTAVERTDRYENQYKTFKDMYNLVTEDDLGEPNETAIAIDRYEKLRQDSIIRRIDEITIQLESNEAYYELIKRAGLYEMFGRPDKAIQDLTRAIGLDPDNINAYKQRGIVNFNSGNYYDAIPDLTESISFEPDGVFCYVLRGQSYIETKQYKKAITDLTKIINLNTDSFQDYLKRAEVFIKLEKYSDALADYTKAINLSPNVKKLYISRARVYHMLGQLDNARKDEEYAVNLLD